MEKNNSLNLKEIGIRIRLEREKFNLSREKLAEIIDLSPFYIGQIERGDRNMSIDTLVKISNTLNISVDYILKGQTVYMEQIYTMEAMQNNYKEDLDIEIKEFLDLLAGLSKENLQLIKDLSKLILPHIGRGE